MNNYYPYPKRDARKHYFLLPNELFDLGLNSTAIAIYAYLIRVENRKDYSCFPSYGTIAKAVGVGSKNTIAKYIYELEEKGLIATEQRKTYTKDGMKRNSTLLYHIRPIQEAVDTYNRKQLSQLAQTAAIYKAQQLALRKGICFKQPDGEQSA